MEIEEREEDDREARKGWKVMPRGTKIMVGDRLYPLGMRRFPVDIVEINGETGERCKVRRCDYSEVVIKREFLERITCTIERRITS